MKLFKLNDGVSVMPTEISEVTVNNQANCITVRLKNGIGHTTVADYKVGVYATYDRVVRKSTRPSNENRDH